MVDVEFTPELDWFGPADRFGWALCAYSPALRTLLNNSFTVVWLKLDL